MSNNLPNFEENDFLDLGDCLEKSAEIYGVEDTFKRASRLMLAYALLVKRPIPAIAQKGLESAIDFNSGKLSSAELVTVRNECWDYLDSKDATCNFQEPETNIIRAVICLLYEIPYESVCNIIGLIDLVNVFLEFVDAFEDHEDELSPLLKNHFLPQ
jgi:hypothetical protein